MGDGLSGSEATDRMIQEWGTLLDDPDEGPVFWLALAATQWRVGRLEPRVLERALAIIDSGSDLRRWDEHPKLQVKRSQALAALRAQLVSPQLAQKRIPKRFRNHTDWAVGEMISYRLRSGSLVVMRVIGYHSDLGGTAPVVELLDWSGPRLPWKWRLRRLPVRVGAFDRKQFMIGRLSERELPTDRVERLGLSSPPSQKPRRYTVYLWRGLDESLERDFGVR